MPSLQMYAPTSNGSATAIIRDVWLADYMSFRFLKNTQIAHNRR